MAEYNNDVDYVSAPRDYAALFSIYRDYTKNFLLQLGIDENNVEDVASDIQLRFMERESLEKFDPDLSFYYRGEMRPARFRSYYSRSVEVYSRGYRDKQYKLVRRELQIGDEHYTQETNHGSNSVDGAGGGKSAVANWFDTFGNANPDHAERVDDEMAMQAELAYVRQKLALVPPRNAQDRCDLVSFFDAVIAQVMAYGEYDLAVLAKKFGVSTTAVHSWNWWFKENLAAIYGREVPAKRPRRTRRDEP